MGINRLRQLEKRLSKKLVIIDERTKWRFPIVYSTDRPGIYFLSKWQDGKFVEVEATKKEVDEYNQSGSGPAVFLPEENNGVVIFKPEKNKE